MEGAEAVAIGDGHTSGFFVSSCLCGLSDTSSLVSDQKLFYFIEFKFQIH